SGIDGLLRGRQCSVPLVKEHLAAHASDKMKQVIIGPGRHAKHLLEPLAAKDIAVRVIGVEQPLERITQGIEGWRAWSNKAIEVAFQPIARAQRQRRDAPLIDHILKALFVLFDVINGNFRRARGLHRKNNHNLSEWINIDLRDSAYSGPLGVP